MAQTDSPTPARMEALVGKERYALWQALCARIEERYDMETTWNPGGKRWVYEYKYRRGGKTLCALYANPGKIGFMVIFGAAEREKAELLLPALSPDVRKAYEEAHTYHDGKWVMFEPADTACFADYLALLEIKRRPNRK